MWQIMWVNFQGEGLKVNQDQMRRTYNLEFTLDQKLKMQSYLKPYLDYDKGIVDETKTANIVSCTVLYPFTIPGGVQLERPMVSNFMATPAAFAHINGKNYMIVSINLIKNPKTVLRLIPEEGEKDSLRRIFEHETVANALQSAGYKAREMMVDTEIYHVRNMPAMIELLAKFYNGIPLADVTKIKRLEERIYTAKELTDMGLGELKLSKHGVEIPIIEQVAPDEFVFYSQNYDGWKKEIDALVVQ